MDNNTNDYYNSLIYNGTLEQVINLYIKQYGMADFFEFLADVIRYN